MTEEQPVSVHGYFVPAEPLIEDKLFDFRAAWRYAAKNKWAILLGVAIGVAFGTGAFFVVKPTYRSSALLQVVDHESQGMGLNSLSGRLGGLTAFAGLRLPESETRAQALAVLSSDNLIADFITEGNLLPVIFWRDWDAENSRWESGAPTRTLNDGVRRFRDRIMSISEEKDSGLVRVTVDWRDRGLAASWATRIVSLANEKMRQRAIASAQLSIEYLQRELSKTASVELRQAMYRLVQEELKNAMLAEVQKEYGLRVLDPAVAPDSDDPVFPSLVVFTVLGGLLGVLTALAWQAVRRVRAARPRPRD